MFRGLLCAVLLGFGFTLCMAADEGGPATLAIGAAAPDFFLF